MRPRVAIAAAGAVAIVAALGACSKNTGSNGSDKQDIKTQAGGIGTAADSKGPAAPVKGATKGGTIYLPQDGDFEHLDPAQIYVNNAQVFAKLLMRPLTAFKDDPKTGKTTLVGDLATDPGTDISNGKCTKWKFTVKDGVKFEDGTPVTAKDVAYGVARSFSPDLPNGPHYIQQWLSNSVQNYNKDYKGPYNGGKDIPPGVTVDGQDITFSFKKPHCDMPFAAAMYTTAAVPKSKDTGVKYDFRVFSDGPYKIKNYKRDTKLTLERNKYWDPKTDPIRHNYPDAFEVDFGITVENATQRLMADQGKDQYAVMQFGTVDPAQVKAVQSNPEYSKRVLAGFTQFTWYLAINNERIKDLKVRKALNYAMDKKAWIQTLGGPKVAAEASTIQSPTTLGFKDYDAYPYNPKKAKKLLGGKHPKIVYAHSNTPIAQKDAQTVRKSLEAVGFKVVERQIDKSNYYTEIGKDHNPYDLYFGGWGSDWPSGSTIIPAILDGRQIGPQGNYNYAYFNNKDVNKKIDELLKMDAQKAAPEWMKLDKEIMTKYAPVVPMYYDKAYTMIGSKVGGCFLGIASGWPELVSVYAKK